MDIFASTRNTRPILEDDLRYIRSDVPTAVTMDERQWLIDHDILTIVDLRTEREWAQRPCPLQTDSAFRYLTMPVTGGDTVPATPEEVPRSYIEEILSYFQIEKMIGQSYGQIS